MESFSENEFSEFGETCLMDETICEILKDDEDWTEDSENDSKEEPRYQVGDELINVQDNDFCSWGFHWDELNTLLKCDGEESEAKESK